MLMYNMGSVTPGTTPGQCRRRLCGDRFRVPGWKRGTEGAELWERKQEGGRRRWFGEMPPMMAIKQVRNHKKNSSTPKKNRQWEVIDKQVIDKNR